jgi:plastocyanin
MKLLMGFIILLVALVAITGCTQTASSSAQTTTETTAPATEVTTIATPVATTVETTVPVTTETIVANVTAPAANVTTVATAAPVNVTPTVTAASGVTTIHITSTGFTPQTDVVLPGTGISWKNDDNVTHSVKMIGNNTGMFNSGDISPGAAFGFTFNENTGTYTYAFADNTTITGTIIVQAGCTLTSC